MAVTPNSLPVSNFVQVSVNLTPSAAQTQNLNNLLVLGSSDVIDVTQRLRTYSTLTAVLTDFGASAPEYLAAQEWFTQSPQPFTLLIGRWAKTATAAKLTGALVSAANQAIAVWNAIASGAMVFTIDNAPLSLTGMSFAAAANLNAVAAAVQVALRAAAVTAGVVGAQTATVVWSATYQTFIVEDGGSGLDSTINFASLPAATGWVKFTGQPANNDTLTVNGTLITFVSGAPSGSQVQIGGSVQATVAALLTFLNASVDANIVKMTYSTGNTPTTATYVFCKSILTGTTGNAYTLAKSAANLTLSGATLAGGVAIGNDVSVLMGLTAASSGAYIANGIAAETALAAATLFDNQFGQQWYALMIPEAIDSDHTAVAGFIQGTNTKHIYGLTTQEGGVLVASSTTDIAYVLQALGYFRTLVQYSSSTIYAVASALAKLLSVNYNGSNTTLTLAYKQEPGVVAEQLSQTQFAALVAKNANVFIAVNNNTAILWPGIMVGGSNIWADVVSDIDWLAVTIMTAVYNALYTSPTKIPQTDAGMNMLKAVIENVCVQALTNGTCGPGTWQSGGFGLLQQGQFMDKGFYVYAPSITTQSQADRAARLSVPFQVAIKLAGAVHDVQISINVNQ